MSDFIPGTVVLVHFPFSDLSQSKKRPALVVSRAGATDVILCQITSRDRHVDSTRIDNADFQQGGLDVTSYFRHNILFTASKNVIHRQLGILSSAVTTEILNRVAGIITQALAERADWEGKTKR